jgi:hypothetical protein
MFELVKQNWLKIGSESGPGCDVQSSPARHYSGEQSWQGAMLRAISQHVMKPVIDQTFAFGKLREVLYYRALSVQFGNLCIQH